MKFVDWVKGWRVASVLTVVAIVGFVAYRLLDNTTATDDIERELRSQLDGQVGEQVTILSVDCPETVEWRPGGEFHCFAKSPDGASAPVTVFMENDAGEYTWRVG